MKQKLAEFVAWAQQNVKDDEKSEAQISLDRLFRGFGQVGCFDVSGTPEFQIKKAVKDGGGTALTDYVWKSANIVAQTVGSA